MESATGLPGPDVAPADRGPRRNASGAEEDGGGQSTFVGFRGKYGLIKTNIVSSYAAIGMVLGGPASKDGILFLSSAEPIADAWIAWGKADPRYMRVVNILWGGPFMTLMIAHAPLVGGIMANHNINVGKFLMPMNFSALTQGQGTKIPVGVSNSPAPLGTPVPEPEPVAYEPAGPYAPTEAPAPPPPYMDEGLRLYPDEGIPSDVDVQLRQAATQLGVPYNELRDQFLLQTGQAKIAQNAQVIRPQTLGQPITRPAG